MDQEDEPPEPPPLADVETASASTSSTASSKKKKSSKAGGGGGGGGGASGLDKPLLQALASKDMSNEDIYQLIRAQELLKQKERMEKYQRKEADSMGREHKFWDTQPVPRLTAGEGAEEAGGHGPIDISTVIADVRQEPYNIPSGFEWCSINVSDPAQLEEVYKLLTENYVEDDDCHFRFDYSVPFLQWALTPPGFLEEWHVGVRVTKTGALMGCITAIPADVRVYGTTTPMVEINFLCVHKKLRTKRLAPVLIKEVTRRVNLRNRWQATYTAGVVLPRPVGKCRYWHRSLNPKKLIEVRFSSLPPRTTMAKHLRDLSLAPRPKHPLRPLCPADMERVHSLLTQSLSRCNLAQSFTVEELAHVLLPREGVVSSFVLEGRPGEVTDLVSFYHLPSSVINNDKHKKLCAVYSYYNVATTLTFLALMEDALILARNEGADVFNALDLAENGSVFAPLKFGQGDGFLQYYLYNWRCPPMEASAVGLVLL